MKTKTYQTDLCVVGGGMAGLCCAIAAARHGLSVVLVQDRPVLGGNASSEIRMWIGGAHVTGGGPVKNLREGGIIEEIFLENFYQNPTLKYPLWDSVLYGMAKAEENLTLLLNTSCFEAKMDGARIESIRAWQSNAETFHVISATWFADCSGDSILAPLTGAKFMYGREAKSDFDERIPPDVADVKTMGMSCLFQIRETDHKVPFSPPVWAYTYETDEDLPYKDHHKDDNFWWIEVGGEWDCIHDTDRCRDELLRICFGVWDHMKNKGDHGVGNWELEWIGFLPGKRESRRYVGKHIVTQNDVEGGGRFADIVAYAGWSMDDHFPAGFYHKTSYPTVFHPVPKPWGLPLRCMISENVGNLTFAGRNISVTHAALSSSRVMGTCAILGQALGTALAQAVHTGCHVADVDIPALQQTLMADDCFIPYCERELPALTKQAHCNADVVRNGKDRGAENLWIGGEGDYLEYHFDTSRDVQEIRLIFDNDMNRRYHNMPCNYPLEQTRFHLPQTLLKAYRIECWDGEDETFSLCVGDNHQRFVRHTLHCPATRVRFTPLSTNGCEEFRVFGFEVR